MSVVHEESARAQVPLTRDRRNWPAVLALVLVVGLTVLVSLQAFQIHTLNRKVATAGDRASALDQRLVELERRAGNTIDTAAVAKKVRPSVFTVVAGRSQGTAFAFGKPGPAGGTYLMTNYHVVADVVDKGGSEVKLERESELYPATIVHKDKERDLAVLLATQVFPKLEILGVDVTPGSPVVVVGAPKGLMDSVTSGVVSAIREFPGESRKIIQFDAPINPGNSGGPVVDKDARVIGVATAKVTNAEGIGFAVAIAEACTAFSLC
ncbi:trypsin-like peptidase domain-containing protein [Longispora sp. NPDC051575]|uniref:S1C family serine protease n=1 Tax=Longispora sp. NPDC051575 TaxID=3154943 RepID=UPI0034147160